MTDRLIRPAEEADLAPIVAIYNEVMQTSFTIWREEPTSVADRQEWLAEASTMGYPVLVATDASGVLALSQPSRFGRGRAMRRPGSTQFTFTGVYALAVSGVACLMRWKRRCGLGGPTSWSLASTPTTTARCASTLAQGSSRRAACPRSVR